MKSILLPTDFSATTNNTIEYGVEIAKLTKVKIILFNAYNIQVELNLVQPIEEVRKNVQIRLKKLAREIQLNHGVDLIIEYSCSCGPAVDEINRFAEENEVDLIVMGMEGSGYLAEKIIGSTTTSLMQKAKCPVLAIDKHVKYKNIEKIALACDYTQTNNKSTITALKEFTAIFNAKLYIVNVVNQLELAPSIKEAVEGIKLEHLLEGLDHLSYYIKDDDVVDGINKFIDEKDIDMIVMIPHMHTVLQNIFHEANTKRMAFHTIVPLLTLH